MPNTFFKKEERGREMPKKLLFATKQLHRNLHKATECNHFKLKSAELEAFSCPSSASNESLHKTHGRAVAHEQPLRRKLCFQGLCKAAYTDTATQAGSFVVATHQKEGWISHRWQDKPQHISDQTVWSTQECFSPLNVILHSLRQAGSKNLAIQKAGAVSSKYPLHFL